VSSCTGPKHQLSSYLSLKNIVDGHDLRYAGFGQRISQNQASTFSSLPLFESSSLVAEEGDPSVKTWLYKITWQIGELLWRALSVSPRLKATLLNITGCFRVHLWLQHHRSSLADLWMTSGGWFYSGFSGFHPIQILISIKQTNKN